MRTLVFTIMFLGGACVVMGYGLMDVTRTMKRTSRTTEDFGTSPSGFRYREQTLPQILPDLRAEELARIAPKDLAEALLKLYPTNPRDALIRLMEMNDPVAVATLMKIHANETSPDRRRAVLTTLSHHPCEEARRQLDLVSKWPAGPDRDWARSLLSRRPRRAASADR